VSQRSLRREQKTEIWVVPGEEEDVNVGVPAEGPVRVVQLPVFKGLYAREQDAPVMWATGKPVADPGRVWQALAGKHPDTGLVPIVLGFLDGGHTGRPWDNAEFGLRCDLAAVARLDAAAVLAGQWAAVVPAQGELESDPDLAAILAPYGEQFPGLAPAQEQALTGAELAAGLGWLGPARMGLVPAARPADVLARAGYHGTANRYGTAEPLCAVLRSWEDRFGAVLAEVGFAHIRILARRPPRTLPHAQAVAAELWTMCDQFWPIDHHGQALHDIGSIAKSILDIPIWPLWLDQSVSSRSRG